MAILSLARGKRRPVRRLSSDWIQAPYLTHLEGRALTTPLVFSRAKTFSPITASIFDMMLGVGTATSTDTGLIEAYAAIDDTQYYAQWGTQFHYQMQVFNHITDSGPTAPTNDPNEGTQEIEILVSHQMLGQALDYNGEEVTAEPSYVTTAGSGADTLEWAVHDLGTGGGNITVSFAATVVLSNADFHGAGGLQITSNLINVDLDINYDGSADINVNGGSEDPYTTHLNASSTGPGAEFYVSFSVPATDVVTLQYLSTFQMNTVYANLPGQSGFNDSFSWTLTFST